MPTAVILKPELWVDRYADYLYTYAFNRVNDPELARDLVQETFFAGLRASPNFRGAASERTWLVAILKRKVVDHYRKINSEKGRAEVRMQYRNPEGEDGVWLEEQVADPAFTGQSDALENEELGWALQECISRLSEKHRHAFTQKTILGKDTSVICNEMGIQASNLWVMVHRARVSLMECLNENWFR